jgi:hypothetical protein
MKYFLKRVLSFLFILLIPAIVLVSLYVYFDPFKVIKKYTTYSYATIEPNRDYISTEIFLANRQKYKYNSFIFGSSRANSFNPDSWSKHLDKQALPFVFSASGESVFGIYTKLKFLEKEKADINNVLILFCRNAYFKNKNYDDHLIQKLQERVGPNFILFFLKRTLTLNFYWVIIHFSSQANKILLHTV